MRVFAVLATFGLVATLAAPSQAQLRLPRPSQKAMVMQTVGTTDLTLTYHRPGVKGRTIWGALVPWGEPWRTGANEATQFVTTDDIMVEGKPLPAGSYALLTIPAQDAWTVVFSRQKDMWGANGYDPKDDALRVTVKPQAADHVEWMQFTLDPVGVDGADLALRWEKTRVAARIMVDVNTKVLKDARAAVAAAKPDDWRTRYSAANWCLTNALALDEAATWGKAAHQLKENYMTLSLMAKLSDKAGDRKLAITQMKKAIELGKADKDLVAAQIEPSEKLLAEWAGSKK